MPTEKNAIHLILSESERVREEKGGGEEVAPLSFTRN